MSHLTSVVVTTYNHCNYIEAALTSILEQGAEPLDVVVVDDGSTDGTFLMAERFVRHGFRVFTQKNAGVSAALNFGMARAEGEVICLFSGDDVLLPGSVRQRADIIRMGVFDFVCCVPKWIDREGKDIPFGARPDLFRRFAHPSGLALFQDLYFGGNFICAPSMALSRTAWEKVGTFDETLWQLQDYDYWLRAAARGKRIYCLEHPQVAYRWHGANLSASNMARSEWEAKWLFATAPSLLSRSDLLELLFGQSFRSYPTPLTDEDLRALLLMRHSNEVTSGIGRFKMQTSANTPDGLQRLTRGLI